MLLRFAFLIPLLCLTACQTSPVSYNGEQNEPTQRIDVFRTQMEVRGLHRVVGEGRMSTDGGESPQAIRTAFEKEARVRGAQAVIIQDPADRPYGSQGAGVGFNQPREVTAVFLRYDDSRPAGYEAGPVSPYAGQRGSAGDYPQPGTPPYQSMPPYTGAPRYGDSPYQ